MVNEPFLWSIGTNAMHSPIQISNGKSASRASFAGSAVASVAKSL